ncbi:MAG: hypothetical protein HRU19_25990 [Pseudobacteriovorax sp.]|nr:hypothetical protein [Pseudobacteriovorax sp.]
MAKDPKKIDLSEIDVDGADFISGGLDLGDSSTAVQDQAPAPGQMRSSDHISNYLADLVTAVDNNAPTHDLAGQGVSTTSGTSTTGSGVELYTHSEAEVDPRLNNFGNLPESSGMIDGLNPYDYGAGDTGLDGDESHEPSRVNLRAFPAGGQAPSDGFSKIGDTISFFKKNRSMVSILALLTVAALFVYSLGDEDLFLETFLGDESFNLEEPAIEPPPRPVQRKPQPKPKPVVKNIAPPEVPIVNLDEVELSDIKNPYWPLPNPAPVRKPVENRVTAEDQESWRLGLSHRFVYQQWKTVKEIRKNFRSGGEIFLFQALRNPKFWVRMEALMALAEQGFAVDVDAVGLAIGDARSGLVSRYMKKISHSNSDGKQFILRQAIRLVEATARVEILKGLDRLNNGTNQLYFAAAQMDPSSLVQSWLATGRRGRVVPGSARKEFETIARKYLSTGSGSSNGMEVEIQEFDASDLTDSQLVREVGFDEDRGQGAPALKPFEEATDGFETIELD